MSRHKSRLTETRTDEDRSQAALDFIEAVEAVCREKGYAIGHQDFHGAFQVFPFPAAAQLEPNLEWFRQAEEVVYLDQPDPDEPPPDPFINPREAKDPF